MLSLITVSNTDITDHVFHKGKLLFTDLDKKSRIEKYADKFDLPLKDLVVLLLPEIRLESLSNICRSLYVHL